MPLLLFFFYLGIIHIYSKECLTISSNEPCLTCLSSYYENSYLTELKIAAVIRSNLLNSDCILKENKKIIRIIHILNTQCVDCSGADATYNNLPQAFEEESKLAIRSNESELTFLMQSGIHYVFSFDFSVFKPELFRRSFTEIIVKPLNGDSSNVSIVLKTNLFFIFISKSLVITNISFIGNDISMKSNVSECALSSKEICCNSSSFSNANSSCYLNAKQINFISTREYKGIFNLEYLFDLIIIPAIKMENCQFHNFLTLSLSEGFRSIFSMAPFSGKLEIYNTSIINCYLPFGFVQFSYIFDAFYENRIEIMLSSEYGSNIENLEEVFIFKNLEILNYNQYFDDSVYQSTIFYFFKCKAKIIFDSIKFENISNAYIIQLMKGYNKGSLSLNNVQLNNLLNVIFSKINDYMNEVVLSLIIASIITNTRSFISLDNINLVRLKYLNISNLKLNNDEGAIRLTNTNLNLLNSTFKDCIALTIILQTSKTLTASFLNFINISFKRSLFYLSFVDLIELNTSYFTNLVANLSPFYITDSELLKFNCILIESSFLFSIFYVEKTKLLSINDLIAKNNSLSMFWKEDQTCDTTLFTFSQIKNNIFFARIYNIRNSGIKPNMLFDQVMISNNNFTSMGIITIWAGLLSLQKFWVINNFFLNVPLFSYVLYFPGKVEVDFQNSYMEDSGVLVKKELYLAFNDNAFIQLWAVSSLFLKNNVFVATRLIDLGSGFISGSPAGVKLEIIANQFLTISNNENFNYKAILLETPKYLRLADNVFVNSRCNPRTLAHSHGAVYISGSSSYIYSKNEYIISINNNTFYNTSCVYGGNIAIISIFNVEIKNCKFYNSSSKYFGGSMAFFSIPYLSITNVSISESLANEGGAIFLKNLLFSKLTNLSIANAVAKKDGVIYIKYAQSLEFNIYEGKNTTSWANGGFMFAFVSNINISNGKISFSQAKEGGAFFLHGNSNLTFENNSISNTNAEDAGAISFYDVHDISIKKLKMDHLIGMKSGAAIVFSVIKNVIIQNLIVEYAFSSGVGVVVSKCADESSMIEINNMICSRTVASVGSCIYHLSAIPIIIVDLKIEKNGDCPLFFHWFFAIQITIKQIQLSYCNIISYLILISGVNINLIDLYWVHNSAESLIFSEFSITTIQNSKFLDNNSTVLNFQDSVFEIANIDIRNQDFSYILSFLISKNSKGKLKNITLANLKSDDNILIMFDNGNLNLIDIRCDRIVGRLLTLTKTNLNFSNSDIYNISTTDGTSNEILYRDEGNNAYYIDIEKTNFTCFQSTSFDLKGRLLVFIRNSSFEFAKHLVSKSVMSRAILGMDIREMNIACSLFINFTQNAILLKTDVAISSVLNVIFSSFVKNEGALGGALLIKGKFQMLIQENIFEGNKVLSYTDRFSDLEGVGGCIFYQALSNEFNFKLFSNNFSNNYASRFISTVFSQGPTLLNNLNIPKSNSDQGKIFSFPLRTRLASIQEDSAINIIVSGTPFDLKLELVDMFNTLVSFDNSTIFNCKILKKEAGKTVLIENSISNVKEGLITFKNFKIKANPNSNFTIGISGVCSGLRSEFVNQNFIETEYYFFARECHQGEIILPDLSCYKCRKGSYSLIDPMIVETKYQRCFNCPNNAECFGGDIIAPLPGFYRKSNTSTKVAPCINSEACLGYENGTNFNGKCLEGNSDALCYYCELSYGKFDKEDYCRKCATMGVQIYSRLVVYGLFMIAYIMLNCHFAESFSIKGEQNESNISTFSKFIVSHSQQVSVILMSSKTMVASVTSLFQTLEFVSFSNGDSISNDCLIQHLFFEKESFVILKEVFTLTLPFAFCFISFFFWNLFHYGLSHLQKYHYLLNKIPKTSKQIMYKMVVFMIISTIIFYPLILKVFFNLFNCIIIDSDDNYFTFLKGSPNMQCWKSTHILYVMFLGIPGILIWGVSFPILLTIIFKKNQNSIPKTVFIGSKNLQIKQISVATTSEHKSINKNSILFEKRQLANTNREKKAESNLEKETNQISQVRFSLNYIKQEKDNPPLFKQVKAEDSGNTKLISSEKEIFAFFYRDFKGQFYYWESLIFFRKFLITFMGTLEETISLELKTLIMLICLSVYVDITNKKQPYKEVVCNRLEIMSLSTIGITVFSNMIFNSETYNDLKIFLFLMTLLSNLIIYCFVGLKIIVLIKKTINQQKFQSFKSFRYGERKEKPENGKNI